MQSLALHVSRVGHKVDCIAVLDLGSTFPFMFFFFFFFVLYGGFVLLRTV